MYSQFSYPIICSKFFVKTVGFYEDYFDFEPVFELTEGFTVLKRKGWEDMYLGIIDADLPVIPEQYRRGAQGLIINFPVQDVDAAYRGLRLEGVNVVSEPTEAKCGRRHFFIEDPNGILIDVAQNVALEDLTSPENIMDLYYVAS